MPRQPRLDAPGTLHHVIGRGIERTRIFRNDRDRKDFLSRLCGLCQRGDLSICAWSLLPNHFHLLVRTVQQPLSSSMRKLLTGYVVNFNRRHGRYGHLFQNRYKSIICEDDPYLLELTRYIHLNPLRAGIVQTVEDLHDYPYTGHSAIMGVISREWQDIETILSHFGKRKNQARESYEGFMREGVSQGRRPELVGGGLLRSLGGWSQVLSVRRKGIKLASDERILGNDAFIQRLLSEAEERHVQTLRFARRVPDLTRLLRNLIAQTGISESNFRSGSRKRPIAQARKLFCQLAVRRMSYSGAEVARFLGLTTSAVNRMAASEEVAGWEGSVGEE